MSGLKTSYEFGLPRGYLDDSGHLHKTGTMRLATARDELEPLRHPTVSGPDDPRLTILVLARVVEKLGDLPQVTAHEIEGLFAVDLAFLQDFYGVINFGSQEEYDALVGAQQSTPLLGQAAAPAAPPAAEADVDGSTSAASAGEESTSEQVSSRPGLRTAVEELPRRAL